MRASAPAKDLSDDVDDVDAAADDDDDAVASAVLARATTARAHRRAADMACERVRARSSAETRGRVRGAAGRAWMCRGAGQNTRVYGGHATRRGCASLTATLERFDAFQ